MKTISNPSQSKQKKLAERPMIRQRKLMTTVERIFYNIHRKGDKAVLTYSRQFDWPAQERLEVDRETIEKAAGLVSERLKQAIELARKNIESFHRSQQEEIRKVETAPGVVCWRESRPITRIGIYIPGGTAPLFSTVLMLAVPAKIAGCSEIVLCTPPNEEGKIHPAILYAAALTGVTKIFAVGGIQAIGAMAFGTESIPKVDKIFGPGNQYVMAAKRSAQYYGTAIDMPAGPSELLVIADDTSNPVFVAADLLSQAEHGPDSQVILLSDNKKVIKAVNKELDLQLEGLPRKEIAAQALKNSKAILFDDLEECVDFSNFYAPEHLILATENPVLLSRRVTTAGSIFLGHYSCESAGDYASGTNHTLPTSGHAAAYSGVSLDSFVKKITFQQLTEEGVISIGNAVEIMAEEEQLIAHKNAMTLRLGAVKARQIAMTGYTQEQVQNQEQEQQIQQGESQASSQTERHDADELPQTEQQDDENGEF
ncbi:Histidinol dehydrogenase [Proteiniphilum saccharofermentans]|uniref:Histidinol dehydrogenase n=1 Tax=Proteiniphilum saccharofermentans TaxID=1642647 RepID=A0A1R3T8J3_9BACT|nr:histidinol dehydrogenase [Proteiniphilum saccharofermentans]SCD20907.1 Histidinol dehydrogenase [Proteiniphilum saccharofermentans]